MDLPPPTDPTIPRPQRGLGVRLFAVGVVALVAAAASSGASTSPRPIDSRQPLDRAEPAPPESGDEDHFDADDAPPPETPPVAVPAGLNEIGARSPWSGIWGPDIEPLARYEPQVGCVPGARPAVAAFAALLRRAFPVSRGLGITRSCDDARRSEHKEGRAYDWGVQVTSPAEQEAAHQLLAWMLATDEHGNEFAMARRLGIMYLIWDDHIWSSTAAGAGWRPYTGPNPHTDHVHISFDWAGATGRTSFWEAEGLPVGPELFGGFSLEDFPSSFDLGHDRYRRELGPEPGDEVTWRSPTRPEERSTAPADEPDGGAAPAAPPPAGPTPSTTVPAPAPSVPAPEPTLPVPLPTTPPTVTVPPPVDDAVDELLDDPPDLLAPLEPVLGG